MYHPCAYEGQMMAAYSDVADALDEICDEAINTDEHGNELNIKYKNMI